jgi:hypothetical protein
MRRDVIWSNNGHQNTKNDPFCGEEKLHVAAAAGRGAAERPNFGPIRAQIEYLIRKRECLLDADRSDV